MDNYGERNNADNNNNQQGEWHTSTAIPQISSTSTISPTQQQQQQQVLFHYRYHFGKHNHFFFPRGNCCPNFLPNKRSVVVNIHRKFVSYPLNIGTLNTCFE